jgi:hypothetical protein
VVVTPPIELVGADETVPPTELEVVSRVVVVTSDVVVGLTVVVVAPLVVVVGLTVVVVAPVVVVDLSVVVVVPPEEVADASCPTLTPASTIMATAISQAAVRLRVLFACLAIDSYLLLSARPVWSRTRYRTNKTTPLPPLGGRRQNSAELRCARSGRRGC